MGLRKYIDENRDEIKDKNKSVVKDTSKARIDELKVPRDKLGNILEIRDIEFSYEDRQIIKGVSFDLEEEQCFCIFGPNGCGKSTLLNCILGVHKQSKGNIMIQGKDLDAMKQVEKAKNIAYVSQKSDKTFPYTVEQIVLMGRTPYSSMFSSPGKEDLEIARDALNSVGMYKFKDRAYTKLSGGESQLVKIARAIAQDTKIVVFDEPTSHLDFRHELNVIKYMVNIIKEKKISVIMATHFPNHAYFLESSGINTKVALMSEGKFQAVGSPKEVLNTENMEKIFKVKTRTFLSEENGTTSQYIVPIDFTKGGEWNHEL